MKKGIIILLSITFLIFIILMIFFCLNKDMFRGLTPKATYKEYKIYDIVEQKGLACAEAIEILDSDLNYDYYFNCLKSDRIYLVSDKEVIKVKEAYRRGIINKESLYELKIVDRMEASYPFLNLEPIAIYNDYKIYDLVEQKGLICPETIDILFEDLDYKYYLDCLKRNNIYFISDIETFDLDEAMKREIVDYEKLYDLKIIDRTESYYE